MARQDTPIMPRRKLVSAILYYSCISSDVRDVNNPSAMMYGLTMSIKNEIVQIAPRGRVNCVAPGWVMTPMAEESLKNPDVVYQSLATYVHSFRLLRSLNTSTGRR